MENLSPRSLEIRDRREGDKMILGENQRLLTEIFTAIRNSTSQDSVLQELRVSGLVSSMDLSLSEITKDNSEATHHLATDGAKSCMALRERMYRPGKGTWYSARFTIDAQQLCEVQYDYDSMPVDPEFNETLADIRDELIEDQRLFPRDQEHLPEWHPARNGVGF
jgi:hypothetical protein